MDNTGDFTIAWSDDGIDPADPAGTAAGDYPQNVYVQNYDQTSDTAGPTVDKVFDATSVPFQQVLNGGTDETTVSQFVVDFSQNLDAATSGAQYVNSVDNPGNWSLALNGALLSGGVASVQFGWNEALAFWV